jgi:gas vesicle protein
MGHAHSIRENPGQLAGIAALSAAIGAITAMLFTPRTGSEARSGIKRRAMHGKDAMIDKIHSKKDEMSDTMEDMKSKAMDKEADIAEKAADKAREKK